MASGVNGNQTDNSRPNSGAVYAFVRVGTTWSQQAYFKASNTSGGDNFGWSVAIDGNTLAVGAVFEGANALGVDGIASGRAGDSGAVYVFLRTGAVWSQQAYVKASNTGTDDSFGESVSISGDTLVVGAPGDDSGATGIDGDQDNYAAYNSGAAFVFSRTGAVWSQQAYVKASNTGPQDRFGRAVAIFGDTLVVGAPVEDSAATGVNGNQASFAAPGSGAVYSFTRTGTTWSQQAYIKASTAVISDYFGVSVAIWDNTLVVGAEGVGGFSGAVFVRRIAP